MCSRRLQAAEILREDHSGFKRTLEEYSFLLTVHVGLSVCHI